MKKLIVSLSAVTGLLAVLFTATPTMGQQGTAAAPARQARPHQVGLIDMAYVFNNYDKFKALQQGVQDDLKVAKTKAQASIDEIKKLSEQLSEIKSDSPDAQRIERDIIRMQAELEAFGRVTQNSNLKREAEIYRQIYLEVQDAIKTYADHYGYTLIIRFDRESVAESTDPQQVLQRLTRQVVHYRSEDDLTLVILKYLNQSYANASGRPAGTPAAANPAGGATR